MALTKVEKSELKLRYGNALVLEEEEGIFIFKRPDKVSYAMFMAGMTAETRKGGREDRLPYFEQLCSACLVHPEKEPGVPDYERLQAVFLRLPGAPLTIGGELNDMAGAGESLKLGKL
jgi:hypothetical protein